MWVRIDSRGQEGMASQRRDSSLPIAAYLAGRCFPASRRIFRGRHGCFLASFLERLYKFKIRFMVSSGQQLTEVWAEHKDALTIMALKELADADVSTNFHWDGSLDVVVGTVLEPEFSLPPRDAPSRSRSLPIYDDNAHRAPAARRDVRNVPAPQIPQAVPKRCINRCSLQPALKAGAVQPTSLRRPTMS